MNIALVMTAVQQGAVVANYVEVTSLSKTPEGRLNGAKVRDTLSNETWDIRAKASFFLFYLFNLLSNNFAPI